MGIVRKSHFTVDMLVLSTCLVSTTCYAPLCTHLMVIKANFVACPRFSNGSYIGSTDDVIANEFDIGRIAGKFSII